MVKPRILFIGPSANRSGAPILLLHIVRWLRQHTDFQMSAIFASEGALTSTFANEIPVQTFSEAEPTSLIKRLLRRRPFIARRQKTARVARLRADTGIWPPDLVFCHSVGAAGILDELGPYACPVLIGVHELEYVLQIISWIPGGAAPAMTRHATHYIAGSNAVRANLINRHGARPDQVDVVHDFVPTADFPLPPIEASIRPNPTLLAPAGVPDGAVVVGIIATVEWRKGSDLLTPLALLLPRTNAAGQPVHLLWVGGGHDADMLQLKFDVATAGVSDRVHVVGSTSQTSDWYSSFTALAVLSREDPFPLVAVEAAACGVPIICFAGAGGVPELVESDAGRVVPFLDLSAFATAIMEILDQPLLRNQLGRVAAKKARALCDVSVAMPKVVDAINRAITGS